MCIFKPPPPVGTGGGYMFSGRASVRSSVIHVVVLCFRDISSICWRIFAKLLSLVHLGTEMNWLDFGVKRSRSRHDRMHPRFSCFRDISSICWRIFAKLLSLVHLGTEMTWLRSRSRHPGGGAQHSTLPSSATFSSLCIRCLFLYGSWVILSTEHSLVKFWYW